MKVIDLISTTKGIRVYSEDPDIIGYYNISMTVYMEDYADKRHTFFFYVEIDEPLAFVPDEVSFPPQLNNEGLE